MDFQTAMMEGAENIGFIYKKKLGSVYASSFISIKHGCHVFMYLKTAQFGPKALNHIKIQGFFSLKLEIN